MSNDRLTPDATRREGINASAIRLSDGAEWSFMRPSARLQPEVVYDLGPCGQQIRRIRIQIRFGYPRAIEVLIDNLRRACDQDSVSAQYQAFFELAVSLVRRAHDISVEDACSLLEVPESETARLVRDVMTIISFRDERLSVPSEISPK